MKKLTLKGRGFTIVELLIVIVVIGILAAISIVAYNGVSDSANNSAIKSDLANMAKKATVYHAEHGRYPSHATFFTSSYGTSATKSSYDPNNYNLYYCVNTDQSNFGISSRSRSGQTYIISSTSGIRETTMYPQWQSACGAFGETVFENISFDYGYNLATRSWKPSIGG